MTRPTETPIGLVLTQTARRVERAFDDALSDAGASRPVWLVLLALKSHPSATQSELADHIGIRGATLTHHLNAMEVDGLVLRTRRPDNRRLHRVELTRAGTELFARLVRVARAHDQRLRNGLDEADTRCLRDLLERLRRNVSTQNASVH